MRIRAALAIAFATGLASSTAAAADRQALTLDYRSPSDLACPDESSFRNLVAARLGYDPFVAQAGDAVKVELTKDRGRLHGRAEIRRKDARDQPPARELDGEPSKCEALTAALATSLAIALDPVRALAPTPPPPPPPATRDPEPPPPPTTPTTPPPATFAPPPVSPDRPPPAPPRGPTLDVGAAFVTSFGETPSVALGATVGATLHRRPFAIQANFRATSTVGAVTVDSGDRVSAAVIGGELAPCVELRPFAFCTFLRVSAYRGHAPDVVEPTTVTTAAAFTGLRIAVSIPLGSIVSLQPMLEGDVALVRTSLLVDRSAVWTAPPVAMTAGVGLNFGIL